VRQRDNRLARRVDVLDERRLRAGVFVADVRGRSMSEAVCNQRRLLVRRGVPDGWVRNVDSAADP